MSEKKTTEKPDSGIADGCYIAEALMKIGNSISTLEPDGTGAYGKFVSLAQLRVASQPLLDRHGLSIVQLPETGEGGALAVRTIITHLESGEAIETVLQLSPEKPTMQSYGATLSYIRRYALSTILGIAPCTDGEDLDAMLDPTEGEAVSAVGPPAPPQAGAVRLSYEQATGKNGKPYFRFKTTDGRRFNLFSNSTFIEAAKSAADASLPVNLEFKQDGKWLELVGIEPAGNPDDIQEFSPNDIPF